MDFTWLSQIFDAILSFFPRRVLIRATHGGVKWTRRKSPKELKRGFHIYWPLVSDIEILPVARQTVTPTSQTLMTADMQTITVSGVVVYSIRDVVKAIGEKNFDVDDTVVDLAQASIVRVMNEWKLENLAADLPGIERDLTVECRRQLRQFGVHVHRAALTDFVVTHPISLLGIPDLTIQAG